MHKFITAAEFKAYGKLDKSIKPTLRKSSVGAVAITGARQVKFILSTPNVDRDWDLIDQKGIDYSHYLTNPVVFLNHEHDELPIGKCVSIGIEDGNLVGVVEFVPKSNTANGHIAEGVYELCAGGYLNCVSIGFIVREWSFSDDHDRYSHDGTDVSACELVEFSVVGIPSNRQALIQEVGTAEDDAPAAPVETAGNSTAASPDAPPAEPAPTKKLRAARLKRIIASMP